MSIERDDMDLFAPTSRAFVSWRASKKRLLRMEEILRRHFMMRVSSSDEHDKEKALRVDKDQNIRRSI